MIRVFLDANVLVPFYQTDLILRAAEADLLQPLWCQEVLNEAKAVLLRLHPPNVATRTANRIDAMAVAFEDAMVSGYSNIVESINCPDPNDRYVIAAASFAEADLILTRDQRHLSDIVVEPYGLQSQTPDQFLAGLVRDEPSLIQSILSEMSADTTNPRMTVEDLLARLQATEVSSFVMAVRQFIN